MSYTHLYLDLKWSNESFAAARLGLCAFVRLLSTISVVSSSSSSCSGSNGFTSDLLLLATFPPVGCLRLFRRLSLHIAGLRSGKELEVTEVEHVDKDAASVESSSSAALCPVQVEKNVAMSVGWYHNNSKIATAP